MKEISDFRSKTLNIAGLNILNISSKELFDLINNRANLNKQTVLFFANSNFIVQCQGIIDKCTINNNIVIANDGIALNIAATLLHKRSFTDNLNGTDFTPYFLNESLEGFGIFLLGAKPEVVLKTKEFVGNHFKLHTVVGIQDGYFNLDDSQQVIDRINAAKPKILLVAMGNPLQENWILKNKELLDVDLIFGVGALFDFWSGDKVRAPKIVRFLKLEWMFRLLQEPKRLFKRYTIDFARFLAICIRNKNN